MLREITVAQTYITARKRMDVAIEGLEKSHPRVAQMMEEQGEDILTVYQLPAWQRRGMKSTNMLERYNQALKRRTRVIRIFPNQKSCLRLVTALAMEMSEEWLGRRSLIFKDEGAVRKTEDLLAA